MSVNYHAAFWSREAIEGFVDEIVHTLRSASGDKHPRSLYRL
jgi:hypothetical protein